jgi:hypothetical protein
MQLSQIASSYSFLYRKSGGTSGDDVRIRGEPQRALSSISVDRGEDSQVEPYYTNYDGSFYDKHFKVYPVMP